MLHKVRPVESHSEARETIMVGPYHNLIPCAEINFGEGGNTGKGDPLPSD